MEYAIADQSISPHVTAEFDRYKRCGILEHGFVRLFCRECAAELVVGFSCKGRGFCPSCGARRATQKAHRLECEVWPQARARQWVLSFPHQVRSWLLRSPELFNDVITVVVGGISFFYERHAALVLGQDQVYLPTAGSVTFIQLFGSSLAANPHLHMMFLDGVFARAKGGIQFFERGGFTHESMFDVLDMIYLRLTKLFEKKGYVVDGGDASWPEGEDSSVPMPFRPRAPNAFRRKGRLQANPFYQHPDPEMMSIQSWLNVRYRWFSLHAAVTIDGTNRAGLRQLFHYGARSSVNLSLLSYVTPEDPDRSEVELRLKRKWNDGTESLIFSQKDFVERLAGVVPPAWFNLTRFHGVFAPNHAWRDFVVPGPTKKRTCPAFDEPNDSDPTPTGKPSTGRAPAEYWIPWAELLRKTVGVDPEVCACGARMILDKAIIDGEKIAEVLARLGIVSTGPPTKRQSTGELDYVYDV
jgi:hypothetical protein